MYRKQKKLRILVLIFGLLSPVFLGAQFSELAQTPPMGWNSWNAFRSDINEDLFKEMADSLVSSGLAKAGYEYVIIDGGWCSADDIVPDSAKFPHGIKQLADYIHSKGLKFGIYTHWRSVDREKEHVTQFAEWGVDYIKNDAYKTQLYDPFWHKMSYAVTTAKRPMVYSIHYTNNQEGVAPNIDKICNMWRFTKDIIPWYNVETRTKEHTYGATTTEIIDHMEGVMHMAKPGHWPDPDMLEIGNPGGQGVNEWKTQFTMWCLLPGPLILGNNLRTMLPEVKAILTNTEAIAINKDFSHLPTSKVRDDGNFEVWARRLADSSIVVALLNRSKSDTVLSVIWSELGSKQNIAHVRDLWEHSDKGMFSQSYTVSVPKQGAALLKISGLATESIPSIAKQRPFLEIAPPIRGSVQENEKIPGNEVTLKDHSACSEKTGFIGAFAYDNNTLTTWYNEGSLDNACITLVMDPAIINYLRIYFDNGHIRTYPIEIKIDEKQIFKGETTLATSAVGFWDLTFEEMKAQTIEIKLYRRNSSGRDQIGIKEIQFSRIKPTEKVD